MKAPYDMDRIVGGLLIFKEIDPPCEVVLKEDGVILAGPDMPPEVLRPDQVTTLRNLGWVNVRKRGEPYAMWRLELK